MIAFDANILIYAEDPGDSSGRHPLAATLLTQLAFEPAIVPVQVLGEFVNVCRRKGLATLEVAADKVANYALIFETPQTGPEDIEQAAQLANRNKMQFFDALIVVVAARAGATILFSEDMQDGRQIAGLRVLNPFNPANDAAIEAFLSNL